MMDEGAGNRPHEPLGVDTIRWRGVGGFKGSPQNLGESAMVGQPRETETWQHI